MAAITPLGELGKLSKIAARNNNWTRRANVNFMKMGAAMNLSALSLSTPIPVYPTVEDEPDEGTTYIHPDTKQLYVWTEEFADNTEDPFPKGWAVFTPTYGNVCFVEDDQTLRIYSRATQSWDVLVDLNAVHQPVERELSCFIPGILRPNAVIWAYVAGMELALAPGLPGAGAGLQIAPSAGVQFTLQKANTVVGTISFAAGSTTGVIDFPNEIIIHPALPEENLYVRANLFQIRSPLSTAGAQGLDFTLRGKLRGID